MAKAQLYGKIRVSKRIRDSTIEQLRSIVEGLRHGERPIITEKIKLKLSKTASIVFGTPANFKRRMTTDLTLKDCE